MCKWRFHFLRSEQPRLINGEARAKANEIELEAAKLVKAVRDWVSGFEMVPV